ncbi:MAG: epoxyqueuosine reductase QueH [Bacteroidales bacterium]|nr:epoxyqueuosine reductase QueH [Bacteroidales bacterium]
MSAPLVKLTPPSAEGPVLLHACCAPCSSAVLECMVQNGIKPVLFFSNSNIDTREEYDKRFAELRRYAASFGIEAIGDEYDHNAWLEAVKGLEDEPERGRRCLKCFRYRLMRAAEYARSHGAACLTTTLASSRWKSLDQVSQAGSSVCGDGVLWWDMNWRKGGLQPRRAELIREWVFYNQTYCGCEFSQLGTSSLDQLSVRKGATGMP